MGAGYNVSNLLGDLNERHTIWNGADWSEWVIARRSGLQGMGG